MLLKRKIFLSLVSTAVETAVADNPNVETVVTAAEDEASMTAMTMMTTTTVETVVAATELMHLSQIC